MCVVLAIVVVEVWGAGAGYQGVVTSVTPVGADQVAVTVEVSNATGTAGSPTCQIQLYSSAYVAGDAGATGLATFTVGRSIPAGATSVSVHVVTVTAGRADAISVEGSSISCR